MGSHDCPCGSGAALRACCGPLHAGDREATTPEALMRSRYAAFAVKDAAYLWKTLASDHEDRARDEGDVLRELRDTAQRLRFMGLRVLASRDDGDRGEVTFLARVFDKGHDRSFVERSEFRREGGTWRYAGALDGPRAPTPEERAK